MILNKCYCEATLENFIELENKNYKRAFHSKKYFHDILIIENNEIKLFERKDIDKYCNGIYREIYFDRELRKFKLVTLKERRD